MILSAIKRKTLFCLGGLLNVLGVHPKTFSYRFLLSIDPLKSNGIFGLSSAKALIKEQEVPNPKYLPKNIHSFDHLNDVKNPTGATFLSAYMDRELDQFQLLRLDSGTLHIAKDGNGLFFYTLADRSNKLVNGQGLSANYQVLSKSDSYEEGGERGNISEACFCLEIWSGNYYHWIVRVLPKLQALYDYFGEDMPKVIMTDLHEISGVVDASIELLGIPKDKFFILDEGTYKIESLFFPAANRNHSKLLERLRERFRLQVRNEVDIGQSLFYVSRGYSGKRRCKNEEQIESRLALLGVTVIHAETLPFVDQAKTFANANLICGLHGAGLSNMIFMPEGASLIEIGVNENPSPVFYQLASALKLNYHLVIGSPSYDHESELDLVDVDIEELCNVVQSAIHLSQN